MNTYLTDKQLNTCYGCRACEGACPKGAIEIKPDSEGFLYPVLNKEHCVNCGICEKVCPFASDDFSSDAQAVYAVQYKETEKLMASSSGGAFSAVADYVLQKGGYVAGSVYDENLKVVHIIGNNENDVARMRGSKYVQSDTADTFNQAKALLEKGELLLYTGTPCQIAGLKAFLCKDYENLITVDLICHGVPSQKLFNDAISLHEKRVGGKAVYFNFRDKQSNGWITRGTVCFNVGSKAKIKKISPYDDYYYYYYLQNSVSRMSCYSCKYAQKKRVSDITIGDFWNIEKALPNFDSRDGVSVMILNTEKSKEIFTEISEKLNFEESTIEIAANGNGNLQRPTEMPAKRVETYKKINSIGFENAAKQDCKLSYIKPAVKRMVPKTLKKKIKKLIGK